MRSRAIRRRTAATAAAAFIGAASIVAVGAPAISAESDPTTPIVTGLSADGTSLFRFTIDQPGQTFRARTINRLTGGDTSLVGIDYRVQDGRMYGVGDAGGVYIVDVGRGNVRLVGRLTVALQGASFGVDFNPAANALRVISDTGQNLRQSFVNSPFDPTSVDGSLAYPATATAPAVSGVGITGAAYTNNDLDATTGTTLFDLDTSLDQIVIQSPANSGSLSATGKLGIDAVGDTGFDIFSQLDGSGKSVGAQGLAVVNNELFSINLLNGSASSLGTVGASVSDLAVQLS